MSTYRDKGIVLSSRAVRDADRRYSVFTQGHGKVVVLAKGSRKARSKMAAHMSGFGIVDVLVARGKITDHLAGAELTTSASDVMSSLGRLTLLQSALLIADALTRRDQPEPELFSVLAETIEAVNAMPEPGMAEKTLTLSSFVIKLTDILGMGLELENCVRCRRLLVPERNALNVMSGGIECERCQNGLAPIVSPEIIKVLRFLRREPLSVSWKLVMPSQVMRELRFVLELQLAVNLEDHLPALRYFQSFS